MTTERERIPYGELARRTLAEGLARHLAFLSGELDITDYIKERGSFFYEHDLDGLESGDAWFNALATYPKVVQVLREIQGVFDLVYLSEEPLPAYEEAGRLSVPQAEQLLKAVLAKTALNSLLEELGRGICTSQ